MRKFKLIFIVLCGLTVSSVYSQLTTSFYTNDSNSKIALGYEFSDALWADFRIYSGTSSGNITPEIVLNYNFVNKENYYTYFGGGIILNNINGILVPVGIGIKPFENLRNLSLNIELNPLYEIDFNDVFFSGFIGIRYTLK